MWVPAETARVIDDACRFLGDANAIILDVRGNGGGDARAVQYLVSHFISGPRLLTRFDDALTQETSETRVLPHVAGGRLLGKPLFVLVDDGTASAAEEFAYHVAQFKLGTLVGAVTAGAANTNTL